MSSEEDYDEEDEFEEEEEEEEEEERKEQEEEEKEETSEYLNDMKPLYERFRDLLLESTRLSRKLRKAKLNGNESTIEYGRDVLDLIKLRVRVSAVEKLMNGPNHMYGAFSAAFLASSYTVGRMWEQAMTSLKIAKDVMMNVSSPVIPTISTKNHHDIAYVLKAFDSLAEKSNSSRKYVTTCADLHRYFSASESSTNGDFKTCFDSENDREEIDFCEFVLRLRKKPCKSFTRAANRSIDALTLFRSVVLRVEYDAACDDSGFASIETLLDMFRTSSEIHLFLNVKDFENDILRRCGTRRKYCCLEEVLEIASRSQICTAWSSLEIQILNMETRLNLILGHFEVAKQCLDKVRTKLRDVQDFQGQLLYVSMCQLSAICCMNVSDGVSSEEQKQVAKVWHEKALNVIQTRLGETHPILANFYFGLASTTSNDFEMGVKYLQKSIDIRSNSKTTSRALACTHERMALLLLQMNRCIDSEKSFGRAADMFEELEDVQRSISIRKAQASILKSLGKFERAARVLEIRAISMETLYGKHSLKCAKPFRDAGIMWRRAGDSVRSLRSLRTARNIYVTYDGSSRTERVKKIDIEIARVSSSAAARCSSVGSDFSSDDENVLASYNADLENVNVEW